MLSKLRKYDILLGSKSPRRFELLKALGLEFKLVSTEVEEVIPDEVSSQDAAEYLARLKAEAYRKQLSDKQLLITADTIVTLNDKVYGKPIDRADAIRIISELSGQTHLVISGVCLSSLNKQVAFAGTTHVSFRKLTNEEIAHYVDTYEPYDKAGAYAIQEWIGMIGIDRIEGDYFNVVGLPLHMLYKELLNF